jgi:hypothetical protein
VAKQHVRVELFYEHTENGVTKHAWHNQADPDDATASAAYARDAIAISHGRGPEQGEPTPSSAALTFKGHTHNPENPASDLYGLIGLNTPIRVTTGTGPALNDTFTRSTTNGWGGTGALSWTLSGGTNPDDWDVNGSEGTITHTDANVLRYSTVDTGDTDHRVRVIFDTSATDITGAGASVWLVARFTDTSNYYAALISIATNEVMTVALYKRVAGTLTQVAAPVAVADTGGDATFDMYGELYIEGNRLYASCWRRFAGDEPLAWMVSGEDDDLTTGTAAGVTGRRETGNTNANLQLRFHEFTAVPGTIRFCGEVADWRPRRAPGGDRWVEVEAGDPLLRLQAPQADALRSALWREILFGGPVEFWPITDGADAPYAASALPGGTPLSLVSRDFLTAALVPLDWEPVTYNAWVEPIATPAANTQLTFIGAISMGAATEWAFDFAFTATADVAASGGAIVLLQNDGKRTTSEPLIEWVLAFVNGEWELDHRIWTGPASVVTTVVGGAAVSYQDGRVHYARVTTVRDGADVDWEVWLDGISLGSGTDTLDWDPLTVFQGATGTDTGQTSMGFAVAWDTATPPFNAFNAAVVGRSGELVGDRLARLFDEEDIAFELVGDAADTEAAGPQLIDTLASNAAACEAVDMGLLHGTRHQVGVTYRTRVSLYGPNQTAVTLDVDAGGEVAPPLEPVIGSLGVVNDVTVKRPNGSSARSVAESGPLNVNPPHLDREGVGRYPVDPPVNPDSDDQLQGLADWRRYRGTIKAVRYPQVTVNYGALAADTKTALAAAVTRLRIGDRVDLDNAEPTGVMQIVPGYSETIGPVVAEHEVSLNGTPANVYEAGVYNAAESRYDSAYSTTAAQITTGTSTSLSVAVETGRGLWVTGSGSPQFPIDLNLLGARVRVTAISGASSPQTFTISTTVVNGINKVIPSGTPVRLWAPRRYAL